MTIEFFTGFEGCNATAQITTLLNGSSFAGYPYYSSTGGFDNGKSVRQVNSSIYYWINFASSAKTKVVGFHLRGALSAVLNSVACSIATFNGPDIRIFLYSNTIRVFRGTTQIADTGVGLDANLHHVEVKLFSDASVGTCQIKIDGSLIYDGSGLDTGGSDITSVSFGSANSSDTYRDNIFLADDWQGELKSYLLKPNSDTSVSWTPSAGSDNYAMVDDVGHDGDTTYVETNVLNNVDLYGFENISTDVTVKAAAINVVARKLDVGDRAIKQTARQDATDYLLNEIVLATGYPSTNGSAQRQVLNLCPDGTAWTPAKLNAIDWGVKVTT